MHFQTSLLPSENCAEHEFSLSTDMSFFKSFGSQCGPLKMYLTLSLHTLYRYAKSRSFLRHISSIHDLKLFSDWVSTEDR
jgi:hypothetical protein